jgi:hypothetical protein
MHKCANAIVIAESTGVSSMVISEHYLICSFDFTAHQHSLGIWRRNRKDDFGLPTIFKATPEVKTTLPAGA